MQERTRWLVLAGILLLAGVVVWRLSTGSYKSDVRKICDAEKMSGVDAKSDIKKVETWAKEHIETPEASAWFAELLKKGLNDRAKGLREEAQRTGAGNCALVATYETLQAEGEYRQDLLGLCSTVDLNKIEASEDAERLHVVLDWIQTKAKSTRTKALGEQIAASDAKGRPDVIREAANGMSVYQCELVATLLKPQSRPLKDEPAIQLGSPDINGDMTVDKVVAAFVAKQELTRKCYEDGLAKKPDLAGRLMLKMAIAPSGKTMKASSEKGTTLSDMDVVKCVVKIARDLQFPATTSPLVTMLLPLDFVPRAKPPAPPTDPHGH